MANELRVTLEVGPKDKKVVAVAPDWPGLERGAKTGEAAIRTLLRLSHDGSRLGNGRQRPDRGS